jgi:penicillin amidase
MVLALNAKIGSLPPLGKLLNPFSGFWQNAEPRGQNFSGDISNDALKGKVTVQFDDRLVPHLSASSNEDLYFVQGYLHARFRLWQMELQTHAAAGRLSEVMGESMLDFDRKQRRKGMVYGAGQSLKVMEGIPEVKQMMDSYTAGVNAYIGTLRQKSIPLEYKLLDYVPEQWTNLKSALLLKYMADDLTGYTEDLELTNAREVMDSSTFKAMYPERFDSNSPVIPAGTSFDYAREPEAPAPRFSASRPVLAGNTTADTYNNELGSNNWAVSGSKTASGKPILCNDPHLGLNLPALWYEIQLQAPGINSYGVSLPGAPGIIIGFNDSISWGFTNGYRDVKDFYTITFTNEERTKYQLDGKVVDAEMKIETLYVRGREPVLDTVAYTVFGPMLYDASFTAKGLPAQNLAVCWMAHQGTNELQSVYLLNRARNYADYTNAIRHFECPHQNMIYADVQGNIAMWSQGRFVRKTPEQGVYVMPGNTSTYRWKDFLPFAATPHVINPERGYVSSANQVNTDASYPLWYNGYFHEMRALRINHLLDSMQQITVEDMEQMQQDDYGQMASYLLPVMLKATAGTPMVSDTMYQLLTRWDYRYTASAQAATVFELWNGALHRNTWKDEFGGDTTRLLKLPETEATMQLALKDPQSRFFDDRTTPETEDLKALLVNSWKEIADTLQQLQRNDKLAWSKYKGTFIRHLARLPAFSSKVLEMGGGKGIINAASTNWGPSWRMVVQMTTPVQAYAVYPGGQSGNPGSPYYDNFIGDWASGHYYPLHFWPSVSAGGKDVKYVMNFSK